MTVQKRIFSGETSFFLLGLMALAAVPATAQILSVGPSVNINRQSGYQGEEAIAIDPTNPNRLFAWANDVTSGHADNSAGYSVNGGINWTSRFTGSDGWPALGGDPTCSFDSFGNLYAASFNSAFSAILVRASTNAGQTFSVSLSTNTGSLDQPTIKAGPGVVAGQQAVWITFLSGSTLVARGAPVAGFNSFGTFGAALTIPGSSSGNFGDIAIGPNGKVVVGYQTPSGGVGPSTITLAVNASGSAAGSFVLAAGTVATQVGGFRLIPAQPSRSVDAELGLAYDISSGSHRGRLHMVYTDAPNTTSNDLNIFTRYSDNDGATWSSAKRVNTDAGTNSQFFPKIALDPTSGNIAVVWYDCRNSAANNRVELWGTVSLDGGVTFLPEVKISAGSTSGVGMGGGNELGDYIGLDFYGGIFHPCWADDSNSTGDNPDGTANLDYYTAAVTLILPPPVASFSGGPTNGIAPLAVTFTNLTTGTGLTNWLWAFGDGATATNSAGTNMVHTYTSAGSYNVSLVVSGQSGAGTNSKTGYVVVLAPTVVNFFGDPSNGIAPLTVTFTNLTTGTGLTNWVWTFGDGATTTNSSGVNVAHTYTNAGSYDVSLVVSGQSGTSTHTITNAIQVSPCVVTFGLQPVSRAAVVGSTVTFSAKAATSATQTNYLWFFQGNPIAGATNATLVLSSVQSTNFGTYAVLADNGNCSTFSSNAVLTSAASPTIGIGELNGTTLAFSIPTEIGPIYIFEFKDNLNDNIWTMLTTLNGDGGSHIVTDSISNAPNRFYRVHVQ